MATSRRGRPPRSGVAARRRVEIVVTEEEREAIERVALDEGKPIATVIREALNEFVGDYSERKVFSRTWDGAATSRSKVRHATQ